MLCFCHAPLTAHSIGIPDPAERNTNAQGPLAVLSKGVLSVGRINSYSWNASLKIRNSGTEALKVIKVTYTGAAMKASVDQQSVMPGDSCTLTASGKEREIGTFLYDIELKTNESQNPSIKIPVRGYVEQPVTFHKPAFMIKGLPTRREAAHEAAFDLVEGVSLSQLRVSLPADSPLVAEVKRNTQGQPILHLHWRGSAQPGWHYHEVGLVAGNCQDPVASTFNSAAEVVPHIGVFPSRLTVRNEELTRGWSRRLRFEFDGAFDGKYILDWSAQNFANNVRVRSSRPNDHSLLLSLSYSADSSNPITPEDSVQLLFKTSSSSSVQVPLVFLGREFDAKTSIQDDARVKR